VRTAAAGEGVRLRLGAHELEVRPQSEILALVQAGEEYAEAGEPAPILHVLAGEAQLRCEDGRQQSLRAGRRYELYDTPTGIFPSVLLSELEVEAVKPAVAMPSLCLEGGAPPRDTVGAPVLRRVTILLTPESLAALRNPRGALARLVDTLLGGGVTVRIVIRAGGDAGEPSD